MNKEKRDVSGTIKAAVYVVLLGVVSLLGFSVAVGVSLKTALYVVMIFLALCIFSVINIFISNQ